MSVLPAVSQFEERSALLPGARELTPRRREALARFEALGLPNRRIESWRYTDLTPLSSKALDYVATAPPDDVLARAAEAIAGLALAPEAARLVFVDGFWVGNLSSRTTDPGLRVDVPGAGIP